MTRRSPPSYIMTCRAKCAPLVRKPYRKASSNKRKITVGSKWNGLQALVNSNGIEANSVPYRWKLHLRPKRLASSHVTDSDLPPLPTNKTAVEVLSDFMKYLQRCAQIYIAETHSESLWKSVETNIDFVLTHPNGWEGAQQSEIRRAVVLAGFISDTLEGQSRIQLLTEGEASLHYCIGNGVTSEATTVRDV